MSKEQALKKAKEVQNLAKGKGKPTVKIPKIPEQPKMTEEEAFAQYINNMITGAVLDHEQIKTKTVDVIKALGQQLQLYMKALAKSEEEKKALEDKLKGKK